LKFSQVCFEDFISTNGTVSRFLFCERDGELCGTF
jgi:hypothetical protein